MIEATIPGPWVINNRLPGWAITNTVTGKTVNIGPVPTWPRKRRGVNWFDRADLQASRRNRKLMEELK